MNYDDFWGGQNFDFLDTRDSAGRPPDLKRAKKSMKIDS
jgi:hypothetical protein